MSKSEQDAKKIMGGIMAVLVIFVLLIPAGTTYYIDERWSNQILAVEGLYENGTIYNTFEPLDTDQVDRMFASDEVVFEEANNDSYYLKKNSAGIKQNKIAHTNFVAYTGGGNYSVTPNYTIQISPPTYDYRGIGVPMNVTSHELAQFDFLRLYTTDEHTARYLQIEVSTGKFDTAFILVSNNSYIVVVSHWLKQKMLDAPDENVYLFWDGQTQTALNDGDASWTFRFESFELLPEHQFFWKNEHLYAMSLVFTGTILTLGLAFSTQILDIKIDRKRGRK